MNGKSSRSAKAAATSAWNAAGAGEVLTPLGRILREPKRRVTPLDALDLATQKWVRGERLDIGQLASELGIARATMFRWVGSREQLYGAVLTQAYERQYRLILRNLKSSGIERLVDFTRFNLNELANSRPLRKFIEQDPEFAIRVLTSKSSPVQARTVALEVELLREIVESAQLKPQLDVDTLGYIMVRIGEAFLYADVISGIKPDIEKAVSAVRILISAEEPAQPKPQKRQPPATTAH
jgi:AcrR family transcriptional regulator